MKRFDRITSNPAVQQGQPCVAGTRITVRRVLDIVKTYPDRAELFREFPELDAKAIGQCLDYAATLMSDEEMPLTIASAPAIS